MTWFLSQLIARLIKEKNLTKLECVLKTTSMAERKNLTTEKINRSSLLYLAVKHQLLETVKYFLELGANPNDIGYEDRISYTCLAKATELNDQKSVETLLQYGADINGVNQLNTTALFMASSRGHIDLVRYLWINGANINLTNYRGDTCLMASIAYPEVCRYLIGLGAVVNAVNTHGNSALFLAIEAREIETILVLLDAGANSFFVNHYGLNATFLVTYMELDIWHEYFESIYENSKNCIAIALEILSCEYMSKREFELSEKYWGRAVKYHERPRKHQLLRCPDYFRSDLQPILHLLSLVDVQVLIFCEFRLGLQHPITLKLLKNAVLRVNNANYYIFLFNFFIIIMRSSQNWLFFETANYVRDMTENFCKKYKNSIRRSMSILESLITYLEVSLYRLSKMDNAAKLSNLSQIDLCHKAILDYASAFIQKCPALGDEIEDYVAQVVALNAKGKKNSTVLHVCVEQNFPAEIAQILIEMGADINAIDDDGKKAVHYSLTSSECSTEEILDTFLKHRLQFGDGTEGGPCLSCLLKENNFLKNSTEYTSLQCLAAKAVAKNKDNYMYHMPRILQLTIDSHSNLQSSN